MCVCVDFCLCLFRWVSGFLRFDGALCLCLCLFRWVSRFLRFDGALCLCLFQWVSVFVSMCVCVVMGLNRLIGVSWVCVWLYVLNRCQRLREKERKKKTVGKLRKTKISVRKK